MSNSPVCDVPAWAGSHYEKNITNGSVGHDYPPPSWAIRRGDWKLMQIMEQGEPMLFNITDDPSESKDMITQHPEIGVKLQKAWLDWFRIGAEPIAWKPEYCQQLKAVR